MKVQNVKNYHPLVLDEKGAIRKRFNQIHRKTRIEKKALAAKVFEIGMELLENQLKDTK